jgi:hypothetical protein
MHHSVIFFPPAGSIASMSACHSEKESHILSFSPLVSSKEFDEARRKKRMAALRDAQWFPQYQ